MTIANASTPLGPGTSPPDYSMSMTEDLVLPFDTTGDLKTGEYPVSISSSLYDIARDADVTLAYPPATDGTIATQINQRISGPNGDLPHAGDYLLTILFTASPSSNQFAMELVIHATR